MKAPTISAMRVIPVAGRDGVGHTGLGDVPGGKKIRRTPEDACAVVEGRPIGDLQSILIDLRTTIHAVTAVESAVLDPQDRYAATRAGGARTLALAQAFPGARLRIDPTALERLHDNGLPCDIRNRDDLGQMRRYAPSITGKQTRY